MNVGIIGSGTWGLALANLLSIKHYNVSVYCHFEDEYIKLCSNYIHPRFPGVKLNKHIMFFNDISKTLQAADVVVFAIPSPYMREMVKKVLPFLNKKMLLVTVSKGLEDNTFLTMSEIIEEETNNLCKVIALSGPTHAEEVILKTPTLCVSTSKDLKSAILVRDIFSTNYFRVYASEDIYGVELCGALKNIIALGAGIAEGLGYGDNAKAALITRGLNEIAKLGITLGGKQSTFYGLAGLGDLVVTATSTHSRNHEAGIYLGQGYSVEKAKQKVGMVIEGLNALKAAYHLANKYKIEMPITFAVYNVVYNNMPPSEEVKKLFNRSLKIEK